MNRHIKTALVAIALFAAPAVFACDYPQRANIPNGQTATKDEMIEGQRGVKAYMAAMDEYLTCIAAAEKDAQLLLDNPDESVLAQRDELLNKRHNAAVDEMEIVAAEFNDEVRAYKAQAE